MRKMMTLLLAMALGSGASLADEIPMPASQFDLQSYAGRVVYMDFWASWCGPCLQSFPWMQEMQAKYADQGLTVIAVNVDQDAERAEEFLHEVGHNFAIVMDPNGEVARKYDLRGMPTSFLIDRDGQLIEAHTGFRQKDRADLEEQIRKALNSHSQEHKS